MTASKLKVKLGRIELEFEGSEEFIKQELMTVLEQLRTLAQAHAPIGDEGKDADDDAGAESEKHSRQGNKNFDGLTTSTIAGKLGPSTGPDLILAAMTRLCLVSGATKVSRKELIKEMRTATAYFKDTYIGNLTDSLKRLITSQRINDLGSDSYSLQANEMKSLEEKLA